MTNTPLSTPAPERPLRLVVFASEQLAPYAAERDRTHAFPADAVRQMGELGMLGMLGNDHVE